MGIDSAVISPYPNNNNDTALETGILKNLDETTRREDAGLKYKIWETN